MDLSRPEFAVTVERDLPVKMRDGTVLRADVHRPDQADRFPVLVERTPYNKIESSETRFGAAEFYASRGYACVFQDVRGRYASDGEFYPFRDDGDGVNQDGYDTVEWAAEQPWSNGNVGTIGGSYSGATQYRMLATRPPHLRAQFVRQSAANYAQEWVYRSGAFELGFNMSWAVRHTASHARRLAENGNQDQAEALLAEAVRNLPALMARLPVSPVKELKTYYPWFEDWLGHPDDGEYWDEWNNVLRHSRVNVPVYHLGGWFDGFLKGTLDNFNGMRANASSDEVRTAQRLTVGPWVHAPNAADLTSCGEVEFGEAAAIGFFETRLRWFDHWLKGIDTGLLEEPPVRLFTMGTDQWRSFDEWPPLQAAMTPLYFRSEKSRSAGSLNDCSLSWSRPLAAEAPDQYEYDPLDPVPTTGGGHLGEQNGPRDQRRIESMVLSYTTPALEHPLDVTGPVMAILYAKTSAKDTDWIVKLSDVHPDGRSMLVCDGVIRARYRKSRRKPELLDGNTEKYEIDLWGTSHVFKRGHRVRVLVTSSDFPRWDRNMNTGGFNAREGSGVTALNTIFHDPQHPSHVLLPVIGRAG